MESVNVAPVAPGTLPLPQGTQKPIDLRPFELPDQLLQEIDPNQEQTKPDRDSVEGQVEAMNKLMEGLGHRLEFGLFGDSDQLFVQIIDRRSNQVVKMIPPEKLLELRQKLEDTIGALIDDRM